MRIGVNALYLIPGGVGGTEIYLRNLLSEFAQSAPGDEFVVFANLETRDSITPSAPNFRTEIINVHAANRPSRILCEQFALPSRASQIDVLFNPGFTAPLFPACPQVTVFHDLQHKRHPEFFRWWDLPFWRSLLYGSAHRSDLIVAVSEETRKDLLRYYRLPKDRVRTVWSGAEREFFEIGRKRGTGEPFLLCVSTLHPHKNIERLMRVFARLREKHPTWSLVLAGMKGFQTGPVVESIASLKLADSVCITGWIPREDLYDLYRRAGAFVFPSTFEGFGIPVVEALAAGIPTACSDIEPLRTIAGDAAFRFAPHDDEAMLSALDRLLKGERPRELGPVRAASFTWENAARGTLAVLRETVQRKRSSS